MVGHDNFHSGKAWELLGCLGMTASYSQVGKQRIK